MTIQSALRIRMRRKCPVSGLRFWADEAIIKGIQDPECGRGMANIFCIAGFASRTAVRRAEDLLEEVIPRVLVRQEVLLFPMYNKSMEKKVV